MKKWDSTRDKGNGIFVGRLNYATIGIVSAPDGPRINCTQEGCEDGNSVLIGGFTIESAFCSGGRTVYVSKQLRTFVTMCEGDVTVVFCDSEDSFDLEMKEQYQFYVVDKY